MSENKYTDEFFKQYEEKYMRRTERPVGRHDAVPQKKKRRLPVRAIAFSCVALILIGAIVLISVLLSPPSTTNEQDTDLGKTDNAVSVPKEPEPLKAPKITEETQSFGIPLNSQYAVFIDVEENTVIAERGSGTVIYPASMTKILTLLTAVDNIDNLDDTFEMTYEITDPAYVAGASMAGFLAGERVTVRDLLYGAILPSGAEATTAIAVYVAGSESEFAVLMNEKARELGITNANFVNASGLHANNHYCTVTDIAVILRAAMEDELCREILSTYQYTTSVTEQHPEGILLTSNIFSRMYGTEPEGADILGGKTGFTAEAGNCIASFGVSETTGKEYIFVTAHASGSWKAIYDHIDAYTAYGK